MAPGMLSAFLTSTAIVALAEIGDKTMLLAIVLAARLRAPVAILLGILVATLANHALAALAGREAAFLLDSPWFRLAVALGFIAMAAWTLIPDKIEDEEAQVVKRSGVLGRPWSLFSWPKWVIRRNSRRLPLQRTMAHR